MKLLEWIKCDIERYVRLIFNYGCGRNRLNIAKNMDIINIPEVDECLEKRTDGYYYTGNSYADYLICQNPYGYYIDEQKIVRNLKPGAYLVLVGFENNRYFNRYYCKSEGSLVGVLEIIEKGDKVDEFFQFGVQRRTDGQVFNSRQLLKQRYVILRYNADVIGMVV